MQKYNSVFSILKIIIVTFCLISCDSKEKVENVKQPNFLFITCEDISPYLSFYGDSTANTPNLDQLAKESLIYDNAFATVGVCSPSRSSIITGMYPVSIGTHQMRAGIDYVGWGNRHYKDMPKELTDVEGTKFSKYGVVLPPEVKCFTSYLNGAGYYCSNNYKTDLQFASPLSAWTENSQTAHFNNRDSAQAFFSVFNHEITHESRLWKKAKDSLRVSPSDIVLPPYIADFEQARIDFARNYSNIEELDEKVGKLLDDLKASGEYENTYIFFFSDHGGPLPRGKRVIYDSGLKVPFMIRFPNKEKVGRTDRLISFVDIAPTILSLANIKIPDYIQGKAFLGKQVAEEREFIFGSRDRFDEYYDHARSIRSKDYMLVKNFYTDKSRYLDLAYRKQIPMMPEFLKMRDEGKLNEDQMHWFQKTRPEIEFYDVNKDPYQLHNLSELSEYAEIIQNMSKDLENWQIKINDKGDVPEAQMVLNMWPNMKQPFTQEPKVVLTEMGYEAKCDTNGADIVYRMSSSNDTIKELDFWKLYTEPIEKQEGKYVQFKATRIGYVDSKNVVVKM